MSTQLTNAAIQHNIYGWIRPDADACEVCGRKEFTTPVDGFQVRACDRCERFICELHAEADGGGEGERVSWICGDEARGSCVGEVTKAETPVGLT